MERKIVVHTGRKPGDRFVEEMEALDVPDVQVILSGPCDTPAQVLEAVRDADVALCGREPYTDMMDNVVLTPHTASCSDKTMEIQRRRIGQDALAVCRGGLPDFGQSAGARPPAHVRGPVVGSQTQDRPHQTNEKSST